MVNQFCIKKKHPTRRTSIVGFVPVQSTTGDVGRPPEVALGSHVFCLPCEEASWVDDVSLNTLADHAAFEELDVPL